MDHAQFISGIRFQGGISESSYLYYLPIIKHLDKHKELDFLSNVTFFVGENGTGKSTLLEAIAVAFGFNAEGGTKNYRFSTNETHSELWDHLTLIKRAYAKCGFFLRAESLYNVSTYMEQIDIGSLHNKSHGESFLSLIGSFPDRGLYLMDEPEAALSPMRQLTLMAEIDAMVKHGSQFIIATHSPILMAFPEAQVLEFSYEGIQNVHYRDTEHYQITKQFLEAPEKMLHYLLK